MTRIVIDAIMPALANARYHIWHHRPQTRPRHAILGGYIREVRLDPFDQRLNTVGSSRVDLQACKLEYSIVSPK